MAIGGRHFLVVFAPLFYYLLIMSASFFVSRPNILLYNDAIMSYVWVQSMFYVALFVVQLFFEASFPF